MLREVPHEKAHGMGLTMVLVSVRSFAQKVWVDYDHEADFTEYSTYAWKEGVPIPSPLMDQRVVDAVEYHLAKNGLLKVESLRKRSSGLRGMVESRPFPSRDGAGKT